jgi:hypothetical protein
MFWAIRRFIRDIPYRIRSIVFRVRHGFPQEDWWNLHAATARFLAPRLRYMAEHTSGYPSAFDGEDGDELWSAILSKMADGFERMTKPDWDMFDRDEVVYVEECLDLFRAFFFNLWD